MTNRTIALTLALASSIAHADGLSQNEMHVIKPAYNAETAVHRPGRIPWCGTPLASERWNRMRVRQALMSRPSLVANTTFANGVHQMCQWADDPTWQRQATYIVQWAMNEERIDQDEAVALIGRLVAETVKERANEGREPTDEERFAFEEHRLKPVAAEPGVDTAKLATIAWCDKAGKVKDKWDAGRIDRTSQSQDGLVAAAFHLCQRPNDATWKQKARDILQAWMNWTKQTQAEAEASLRARMFEDTVKQQLDDVCRTLPLKAEVSGKEAEYTKARRDIFGCNPTDPEMWQRRAYDARLDRYIELEDEQLDSELIRVHWLYGKTHRPRANLPSQDASENLGILLYAAVSVDFAALDGKRLDAEVAKAYPNNELARAIANETFAELRWRKKLYEQAIDKLAAGDADYPAILRDAPKQGFARWRELQRQWKPEIERARAFEAKLDSTRPAVESCDSMVEDLKKLLRSYKAADFYDVRDKLADDPIAPMLVGATKRCLTHVNDKTGLLEATNQLGGMGREARGPRALAYYAMVDALGDALAKRPKMLLSATSFRFSEKKDDDRPARRMDLSGREGLHAGIVVGVKKVPGGFEVSFQQKKFLEPIYDCKETNKIDRITWSGRIEYRQHCWNTGKSEWVERGPRPIVVLPHFMTGIKPGVYANLTNDEPSFVKAKADATKVIAFCGFEL